MNWEKAKKIDSICGYVTYYTRKDWRFKDLELYNWKSQDMGRGKTKKGLKRLSARTVRRYKGDIPNGGAYKKIVDLQWILF